VREERLKLAPGVTIEHVGDEFLVLLPGSTEILRLSGDAAAAVRKIHQGKYGAIPPEVANFLVARGVFARQDSISRRGVIKAGAIGVVSGAAVLTFPAVAAAASSDSNSDPYEMTLQGNYGSTNGVSFILDFGTPFERNPGGIDPGVTVDSAVFTNSGALADITGIDGISFGTLSSSEWDIRVQRTAHSSFSDANTSKFELTFTFNGTTYDAVWVKP
jgi:hypothetical protein